MLQGAMLRTIVVLLCRIMLRIFFRRIEVRGTENIPKDAPVIFFLNHPNGLVDPLFILCLAGRPVSFLAKAPLFKMPVVKYFARSLECLPVYRKQDGGDMQKNAETLKAARTLLGNGGAVAIFPEGRSHSDPSLSPLKTGGARIALGVGENLRLIPAGLFYDNKGIFRSNAVLSFGKCIDVPPTTLDSNLEPPREDTLALNERIRVGLGDLTVQAENHDLILFARIASTLLGESGAGPARHSELVTRLLKGRDSLLDNAQLAPRLEPLLRRLEKLHEGAEAMHLPIDQLGEKLNYTALLLKLLLSITRLTVLAPVTCVGLLLNYPTYRLIGVIARRVAGDEEDILSTLKMLGALLLFPLTWLMWAVVPWIGLALLPEIFEGPLTSLQSFAGLRSPWLMVGAFLILQPLVAWLSLKFFEQLRGISATILLVRLSASGSRQFVDLQQQAQELRNELIQLGQWVEDE